MNLVDMLFWFVVIWIISLICLKLHRRSTSFIRSILNVFGFIDVLIHELGHALMCFLFEVPIMSFSVRFHNRSKLDPHGHVGLKEPRRISFLQGVMITLGPLFLSTWVFLLCLDLIWVQGVDIIAELILIGIIVSVAIGASPSRPDLTLLMKTYRNDPFYSIYQLSLAILSFLIVYFIIDFSTIVYLPMELLYYIVSFFTIVITYFILRYSIKAVGYSITKISHISIISRKNLTRRRHRPRRSRSNRYKLQYKSQKEVINE